MTKREAKAVNDLKGAVADLVAELEALSPALAADPRLEAVLAAGECVRRANDACPEFEVR